MKKTICAVTAAMLALTSVLCGCSSNGESSSQSGSTTPATVATDTTVKTTGEKIHINDSTLGEIWITELDGVPKNTLNNDNFTSDDTFKYYSENGKAASMKESTFPPTAERLTGTRLKNRVLILLWFASAAEATVLTEKCTRTIPPFHI